MGPLEFQGVALFKGLKGYFLTYVLSSVFGYASYNFI
jgi:hypothetical protein